MMMRTPRMQFRTPRFSASRGIAQARAGARVSPALHGRSLRHGPRRYEAQLKTTKMFTAAEAVAFTRSLAPGTIGHEAIDAINQMAFKEDIRSGKILLWNDTAASLARLFTAVSIAALAGLIFGILNGLLPYARSTLSPAVTVISLVPPLAVLPILFIVFGVDELSKVMLIVIGITPVIIRDLAMRVETLPGEQLIKAQTLGANTWQIVMRVVLPQMLPKLIDAARLSSGAAWLFLIAAQAVALYCSEPGSSSLVPGRYSVRMRGWRRFFLGHTQTVET